MATTGSLAPMPNLFLSTESLETTSLSLMSILMPMLLNLELSTLLTSMLSFLSETHSFARNRGSSRVTTYDHFMGDLTHDPTIGVADEVNPTPNPPSSGAVVGVSVVLVLASILCTFF